LLSGSVLHALDFQIHTIADHRDFPAHLACARNVSG
jgi:hypothetical protein